MWLSCRALRRRGSHPCQLLRCMQVVVAAWRLGGSHFACWLMASIMLQPHQPSQHQHPLCSPVCAGPQAGPDAGRPIRHRPPVRRSVLPPRPGACGALLLCMLVLVLPEAGSSSHQLQLRINA